MNYPSSCPATAVDECDYTKVTRRCTRPFGHGYDIDGVPIGEKPNTPPWDKFGDTKHTEVHHSAKHGNWTQTGFYNGAGERHIPAGMGTGLA